MYKPFLVCYSIISPNKLLMFEYQVQNTFLTRKVNRIGSAVIGFFYNRADGRICRKHISLNTIIFLAQLWPCWFGKRFVLTKSNAKQMQTAINTILQTNVLVDDTTWSKRKTKEFLPCISIHSTISCGFPSRKLYKQSFPKMS